MLGCLCHRSNLVVVVVVEEERREERSKSGKRRDANQLAGNFAIQKENLLLEKSIVLASMTLMVGNKKRGWLLHLTNGVSMGHSLTDDVFMWSPLLYPPGAFFDLNSRSLLIGEVDDKYLETML